MITSHLSIRIVTTLARGDEPLSLKIEWVSSCNNSIAANWDELAKFSDFPLEPKKQNIMFSADVDACCWSNGNLPNVSHQVPLRQELEFLVKSDWAITKDTKIHRYMAYLGLVTLTTMTTFAHEPYVDPFRRQCICICTLKTRDHWNPS